MKKILLGLLGIIILLIIVGFFLPSRIEVTRSLTIHASPEATFEQVNNLKNWEKWSYWYTLDPTTKLTYGDQQAGTGAWYSWTSEDMGQGKLTITESNPSSVIKADLDFMEQGTAKCWYTFEPVNDSTKVTMGFSTEFGMNPFMRWMGATMFEGEMNKAFDHNLNKIKELTEGE